MSYVIQAVLSNAQHPEYGQVTILNEKRDSLHSLNAMCGAIAKLEQKDRDKLEAVIVFAEPENAGAIRRLAENLEQFDFIPGIHTPEEYGRYMIRESGRFE